MSAVWGTLAVLAVGLVIGLSVRGQRRSAREAAALDQTLVSQVILALEQAEHLYPLLSCAFQSQVPLAQLAQALAAKRVQLGLPTGRRLIGAQASANLFTMARAIQLDYELTYPRERVQAALVLTKARGASDYRVDGFYQRNASDSLDAWLW